MSIALVRLFLLLTLLGHEPELQLFEVSAYTRLCTARDMPWFGKTASGEVAGLGMCALPAEYPFGTLVWLDGGLDGGSGWGLDVRKARCADRGGAIQVLAHGVVRADLCFTGISACGDEGDERAAKLWGRRYRVGIVVQPGALPVGAGRLGFPHGYTDYSIAQMALVCKLVAQWNLANPLSE